MNYQTALNKTMKLVDRFTYNCDEKEDLAKSIVDALGFKENDDESFNSLVEEIRKNPDMNFLKAIKILRETGRGLKESHNAIARAYGRNLIE